jgi:hypothetical protein
MTLIVQAESKKESFPQARQTMAATKVAKKEEVAAAARKKEELAAGEIQRPAYCVYRAAGIDGSFDSLSSHSIHRTHHITMPPGEIQLRLRWLPESAGRAEVDDSGPAHAGGSKKLGASRRSTRQQLPKVRTAYASVRVIYCTVQVIRGVSHMVTPVCCA